MIIERIGDILESEVNIICHQTNCKGVMGGGIAKTIRDKIFTREQFDAYQTLCKDRDKELLGMIQPMFCKNKVIVNCFGEYDHKIYPATDYDALYRSLKTVKDNMILFTNSGILDRPPVLGIPGLIGCGLAGGSWDKVYEEILVPLFAEEPQDLYIYYFTEEIYKKNHKGEKS